MLSWCIYKCKDSDNTKSSIVFILEKIFSRQTKWMDVREKLVLVEYKDTRCIYWMLGVYFNVLVFINRNLLLYQWLNGCPLKTGRGEPPGTLFYLAVRSFPWSSPKFPLIWARVSQKDPPHTHTQGIPPQTQVPRAGKQP